MNLGRAFYKDLGADYLVESWLATLLRYCLFNSSNRVGSGLHPHKKLIFRKK